MFPSLGMPEILLILVIALVVFGPKQIPEVGKVLGKTLKEFRRASMSGWDEVLEADKEAQKEAEKETAQPRATATEAQEKP
jgi:sec-independent protein translocase protein TatA